MRLLCCCRTPKPTHSEGSRLLKRQSMLRNWYSRIHMGRFRLKGTSLLRRRKLHITTEHCFDRPCMDWQHTTADALGIHTVVLRSVRVASDLSSTTRNRPWWSLHRRPSSLWQSCRCSKSASRPSRRSKSIQLLPPTIPLPEPTQPSLHHATAYPIHHQPLERSFQSHSAQRNAPRKGQGNDW